MPKNPSAMGKRQPMVKAEPLGGMSKPFTQRGGKMHVTGIGKKAKRIAEEVPIGPMKK